jgi:hypothetical protein
MPAQIGYPVNFPLGVALCFRTTVPNLGSSVRWRLGTGHIEAHGPTAHEERSCHASRGGHRPRRMEIGPEVGLAHQVLEITLD